VALAAANTLAATGRAADVVAAAVVAKRSSGTKRKKRRGSNSSVGSFSSYDSEGPAQFSGPQFAGTKLASLPEEPDLPISAPSAGNGLDSGTGVPELRFLVVDDVPMNRKMLILALEKVFSNNKLIIVQASDGGPAVAAVKASIESGESFDCIFTDSVMYDMHGPEAVTKIRKLGFSGCIVGVTGNALLEDIDSFKKCGLNEVLVKPVTRPVLAQAMEQHGLYVSR
jgi:CheY-like chemotaxis protein